MSNLSSAWTHLEAMQELYERGTAYLNSIEKKLNETSSEVNYARHTLLKMEQAIQSLTSAVRDLESSKPGPRLAAELDSSFIDSAEMCEQGLLMEMHGKIYLYKGATERVLTGLIQAESAGRFYNTHIKDMYQSEIVDYPLR